MKPSFPNGKASPTQPGALWSVPWPEDGLPAILFLVWQLSSPTCPEQESGRLLISSKANSRCFYEKIYEKCFILLQYEFGKPNSGLLQVGMAPFDIKGGIPAFCISILTPLSLCRCRVLIPSYTISHHWIHFIRNYSGCCCWHLRPPCSVYFIQLPFKASSAVFRGLDSAGVHWGTLDR